MKVTKAIDTRGSSGNSGYVLDNAGEQARARFDALSAVFDPGTIRHLETCGIGSGWHCLEVGGGGGSIAAWLSKRVGPTGRVLVTDIDPRHLQSLKFHNLEVRSHILSQTLCPRLRSISCIHGSCSCIFPNVRRRSIA